MECFRCPFCGCICDGSNGAAREAGLETPHRRRRRAFSPTRAKQLKAAAEGAQVRRSPAKLVDDEEGSRMENDAGVTFHLAGRKEFKCNPLQRFLSVEIEVAELSGEYRGINVLGLDTKTLEINEVVERWRGQLVRDISLPRGGFEINSAPANGDKFIQQLEEITRVLRKFGASCENTMDPEKRVQPCGLHVHGDARDFSYWDLRRFFMLYAFLEPTLYKMLPGWRRNSHYAQRCGVKLLKLVLAGKPLKPKDRKKLKQSGPGQVKAGLIAETYQDRLPAMQDKRSCPQEVRYRALNTHAWFYRGTLEFRHMYGTVELSEMLGWAMLVGSILDLAYRMPEAWIAQLPKSGEKPEELLKALACNDMVEKFIDQQLGRFAGELDDVPESPILGRVERSRRRTIADVPPQLVVDASRLYAGTMATGGEMSWSSIRASDLPLPPDPESLAQAAERQIASELQARAREILDQAQQAQQSQAQALQAEIDSLLDDMEPEFDPEVEFLDD